MTDKKDVITAVAYLVAACMLAASAGMENIAGLRSWWLYAAASVLSLGMGVRGLLAARDDTDEES